MAEQPAIELALDAHAPQLKATYRLIAGRVMQDARRQADTERAGPDLRNNLLEVDVVAVVEDPEQSHRISRGESLEHDLGGRRKEGGQLGNRGTTRQNQMGGRQCRSEVTQKACERVHGTPISALHVLQRVEHQDQRPTGIDHRPYLCEQIGHVAATDLRAA